jgi:ABC-type bacteriocin/lantibiotic exporter with double-glycine peptidase domain
MFQAQSPLSATVAMVLLFALSPYLTVVSLAALAGLMCLIHFLGNTIENSSRRLLEEKQRVQGYLVEQLSTAILGRAFDRGAKRREEFTAHCEALSWRTRIYALTEAAANEIEQLLPMIARGVLLLLGAYFVMVDGSMDASVLIKMLMLFPLAVSPVSSLADLYVSLRISLAPARRILRLLDLPREYHDDPEHPTCPGLKSRLELRKVGYRTDEDEILRDVNLTVEKGRRYFVGGESGAGKTTLLNLVAGVYTATSGEVLVDGTPLVRYRRSTWLARVGMVMQDPVLLNLSVRENLLLHGAPADDDRLFEVLDRVDLGDRIRRMRNGLGCSCGNRGELFSGGERQRLAIARALLADPEILILDEPSCMLDEANRERFRELLDRIAEGRTLIMAAHDRSLEDLADVRVTVADRTVTVD